jgi:hypothetical protein
MVGNSAPAVRRFSWHLKPNAFPRGVNVSLGIFHAPSTTDHSANFFSRRVNAQLHIDLRLTCLLQRRQEEVAAAPPAIWCRELFHSLADEATAENSTPWIPGPSLAME